MVSSRHGRKWAAVLETALKSAGRIVFLGVGNCERGDDAAGCKVVRILQKKIRIKKNPDLLALDGGKTPESLTGEIRRFGPDLTVIVDAAAGGHEPGTIFIVDREKIGEDELSTHRIPLSHLIRYLEDSVGCRALLIGIEPLRLEWGGMMSLEVRKAVEFLAGSLAESLIKTP